MNNTTFNEDKNPLGVASESPSPTQARPFALPLSVRPMSIHGSEILDGNGEQLARDIYRPNVAEAFMRCVNQSPVFDKLFEAAQVLDRLDWIAGYELTEANMRVLDEALDLTREALRLANGQAGSE